MKVFSLTAAVATALLMAACANGIGDNGLTANGYRYEFHNDVDGETVKPGDVAMIYLAAMKGDSVMGSSRDESPEPQPFIMPADSSENRAANLFADAVALMSPGDSMSIFLSLDTIEQLPPGFTKDDELRYTVVLASVQDSASFLGEQRDRNAVLRRQLQAYAGREQAVADSVRTELAAYKAGASRAGYTTTSSGLKYKILEAGNGQQPSTGQPIYVSYYGVLTDNGEMFDNSFRAGRSIDFPVGTGQVIPGWDEGLLLLSEGSRAILAIPSDLAYGDNPRPNGPIPPGAELMFYVQLDELVELDAQ